MEVQILAKEIVKPSSPTTKTFNLSFIDQQLFAITYTKLFFFYQNSSQGVTEEIISKKLQCLKLSLSEVLTHFYPLAGRTKDAFLVVTGQDDGVEFVEARVNGTLSEYLAKPDLGFLPKLVTDDHMESWGRPLLIVQANFFACGGLAIGINISHRVTDAAAFTYFVNAWASTAITKLENVVRPDFRGSIVFPPSDKFFGTKEMQDNMYRPNVVGRRFLFSASHIVDLQRKATKPGMKSPSRVLTISAFLWRIGMKMATLKAGGCKMPSTLNMTINLRSIVPPPIFDHSFGNLIEVFTVHNPDAETETPHLIGLLKKKIEDVRKAYHNKILQGEKHFVDCTKGTVEAMRFVSNQKVPNNFSITSWCRFPLYDADFGWGKPTWVAPYSRAPWIVLTDASDGTSIEAWIALEEADIDAFAKDEELLAYASVL